ncbi:MAG: TlpA family protein disulfide reductase [Deltaproteobacteria bacterium]|nr:TlpA family protein disulfide reductase [Deltaproteobacteria bacterium]
MRSKWNTLVPALLFLAAVAAAARPAAGGAAPSPASLIGKPAPGFTVATVKGDRVDLKQTLDEGKVVVLNFWGLRCGACLAEIPVLNAMQEKFAGRARFLGVNVDGVDAKFLEKQMAAGQIAIRYDTVTDADFTLIELYRMNAAPYTVVIDPGGTIRYQHEDYKPGDEKELEKAIEDAFPRKTQ